MRRSDRVTSRFLAGGRVAAGVVMVTRPTVLPQALGVDAETAVKISYLPQMLGAREIGIGLGTLASRKQGRLWATVGVLADAGDLAAMVLAIRAKAVKPAPGAGVAAIAAGATWVGVQGVLPHRKPKPVTESVAESFDSVVPRSRDWKRVGRGKAHRAVGTASDLASTAKSRLDDAHLADRASDLASTAKSRLDDAHLADRASDLASTAKSRLDDAHLADRASDLASSARSRLKQAHLDDRAADLASTARSRFDGLNLSDRLGDLSDRASDLTAQAQKVGRKQAKKQRKAAEKSYAKASKRAQKKLKQLR